MTEKKIDPLEGIKEEAGEAGEEGAPLDVLHGVGVVQEKNGRVHLVQMNGVSLPGAEALAGMLGVSQAQAIAAYTAQFVFSGRDESSKDDSSKNGQQKES